MSSEAEVQPYQPAEAWPEDGEVPASITEGTPVVLYRVERYEGVVSVQHDDWDTPTGIELPDGVWMRIHGTDDVRHPTSEVGEQRG